MQPTLNSLNTIVSYRKIWDFGWPIALSLLAQNIVNVTDTIFMGRVGEVELGAAAIGGLFYTTLFMVGFGFTTGVQILIARREGEKNYKEIGTIFDNSFYFLAISSVLITILIVVWGSSLLNFFLASDAVFKASSIYLENRVYGLIFASSVLLFRSFYTGIAFTRYLFIGSAIMALVNILLDYLMIFGHWGFPVMGIAGAAIASVISEACALLFYFIVTVNNRKTAKYSLFQLARPHLEIIKSTFNISIYVMLQYFLSIGSWFIFFLIIEKMGERALAVSNIIRSLYLLLMIPGWALCSVVSTLVSSKLGEGNPEQVLPIIRKVIVFSLVTMLPVVFLSSLFPRLIISIYTNNFSLVEASVPSYYIILGALIIFSLMSILFNGLMGTANTKISLAIEVITLFFYLVFTWLIAVVLHLSIEYVWTSEYLYGIMIGILSLWYLLKGRWREKVI